MRGKSTESSANESCPGELRGSVPSAEDVEIAKENTNHIYCEELDRLAHEVIRGSVECMKGDRSARNRVFYVLFAAYAAMFVIGLAAFAAALYKGLMSETDAAVTGVFAGMSLATFVTLFLLRPLEKLKNNSIYLTWLNVATTSYWTRHYYLNKRGLLDSRIEVTTRDTLAHLRALMSESASSEHLAAPRDDTMDGAARDDEFDIRASEVLQPAQR